MISEQRLLRYKEICLEITSWAWLKELPYKEIKNMYAALRFSGQKKLNLKNSGFHFFPEYLVPKIFSAVIIMRSYLEPCGWVRQTSGMNSRSGRMFAPFTNLIISPPPQFMMLLWIHQIGYLCFWMTKGCSTWAGLLFHLLTNHERLSDLHT